MPRPKRCRRICGYPDYWSFVPEGAETPETILMTLDEYEAVRLIDFQKLTQEECAAEMRVSRTTVTGIYDSARFKISDAMINGKRLRITGGTYQIDAAPEVVQVKEKGGSTVRIAVTYEQGMVGQHFGRTEQFKLYDIEGCNVKSPQVIDTNGTGHGALAGFLKAAEVDTLICGGIGMGARMALQETGIELFPGVSGNADEVVKEYLAGTLSYNPDESCQHHDHVHEEGHECHHGGSCGDHGCHM